MALVCSNAPGGFQTAILPSGIKSKSTKRWEMFKQVADEPARRQGNFFDERRGRDNLVVARQFGLLIDVDHFQFVVIL